MATQGGIFNKLTNTTLDASYTVFTSFNLILTFATITTALVTLMFFAKDEGASQLEESVNMKHTEYTDLERNSFITPIIAALGLIYSTIYFMDGGKLGLNIICSIFLFTSLLLHRNIQNFLNAFNQSISNASGIIIQFPFYAAIMAMMSQTGLATDISQFFVSISNKNTIMIFTYLSSGLINFFVPSGGGQWAIQAPIIVPAAQEMGVDIGKMAMSVAWGDAWTNIIQPFWAIPLLSMAGLSVRHIFKYCLALFFTVGLVGSFCFYLIA